MHPYTIEQVAYTNANLLARPPRAMIIDHIGLGYADFRTAPWEMDGELSARNILTVFPFVDPWSWMNRETRAFVDALTDKAPARYTPPPTSPLIPSGGSMGGMSSLLIPRYSRHKTA